MIKREEGIVCRTCVRSIKYREMKLKLRSGSFLKEFIIPAAVISLFVPLVVFAPNYIILFLTGTKLKFVLLLFLFGCFGIFLVLIMPYFFVNALNAMFSFVSNLLAKLSYQGLFFKGRPTGFQIVPDNPNAEDGDFLELEEQDKPCVENAPPKTRPKNDK
jgi:hypothetical protein